MASSFYWHGPKLKNEFQSLDSVSRIRIASAYFSGGGMKMLQEIVTRNRLAPDKVEVFLSPEFSTDSPGKLLGELRKIASVSLVAVIKFHPKVYLFEGASTRLIFGSSNLTEGGVEKNIEFDRIEDVSASDLQQVNMFFEFCRNSAIPVSDEIVAAYDARAAEFNNLRNVQRKISQELYAHFTRDDPFAESDYDFSDTFFKFPDYEILFPRNQRRDDSAALHQRKALQAKLLSLHEVINPTMKRLDLHCHWMPSHITSLIRPCIYNKGRVAWMGVRYGKSDKEIRELINKGANTKDDEYGFPKHSCIQFCLNPDSFEVCLFHSVRHGAIDRDHVRGHLAETGWRSALAAEIGKLKGRGMVWLIWDGDKPRPFDIDNSPPTDFLDFYKANDCEGRDSYLSLIVKPDDARIKDANSIAAFFIDVASALLPLYSLMAYRPKH